MITDDEYRDAFYRGYTAAIRELYDSIRQSCDDLLESDPTDTEEYKLSRKIKDFQDYMRNKKETR